MLELLPQYTWPTDCFPLASLCVRVDELAKRFEMPVFTWVEEGLGPARGFGCRLASGCVFLLEELEESIRRTRAKGPNVYVDAADVARHGVEKMVDDFLDGLCLTRADVDWLPGPAAWANASTIALKVRAYELRRQSGADQNSSGES